MDETVKESPAARHEGDPEAPPPSGLPLIQPDTKIDHFRVIRLLGRGGLGEVYLARDTALGRTVPLKLIHRRRLGAEGAAELFLAEARTTAKFNHPHIVTIYAVGEHRGVPYVALEYLAGQNLRQRLDDERPGVRESVRIALAIADALEQAHGRGILHRDLKPANVVIPRDGRLRVVDFGLAKRFTTATPAALESEPLSEHPELSALPTHEATGISR